MSPSLSSHRDIAKNALLRWRVFIYWTFLGVFDALVFFFGAYFMFENTTVTSNGQVSAGHSLVGLAAQGSLSPTVLHVRQEHSPPWRACGQLGGHTCAVSGRSHHRMHHAVWGQRALYSAGPHPLRKVSEVFGAALYLPHH